MVRGMPGLPQHAHIKSIVSVMYSSEDARSGDALIHARDIRADANSPMEELCICYAHIDHSIPKNCARANVRTRRDCIEDKLHGEIS